MDRITERHIEAWTRDGYVVVAPFLVEDELRLALDAVYRHFPEWEAYAARPEGYQHMFSNGLTVLEFPYAEPVLNRITLHPAVLMAVRDLLGTEDIRLTQSMVLGKYGYWANTRPHSTTSRNSTPTSTTIPWWCPARTGSSSRSRRSCT